MLRRNKDRTSRESTPPSTTPKTIGDTAVFSLTSTEAPAVPEKSYADEVRDRVIALASAQREFLMQAAEKGVSVTDLPKAIADAMNAGVLPRIIRLMEARSSAALTLFDGSVPSEALCILDGGNVVDRFRNGDTSLLYVVDDLGAIEARTKGFSTHDLTLPLVDRGDPIDPTVLADIDAHLYPQISSD